MSDKQWVQHISGQGEKWEVVSSHFQTSHLEWKVYMKSMKDTYHWLPKSEYRLCEPPEVWVDVTKSVVMGVVPGNWNIEGGDRNVLGVETPSYRLRKAQLFSGPITADNGEAQWAFIVEKKVNP